MRLWTCVPLAFILAACGGSASSSRPASQAASSPVASASAKPAAASAAASAGTQAGGKPELDHVTLVYPTLSGDLAYIPVAAAKGFFQKYGVQVDVQYAQANTAIASLIANKAQFANGDGVLFLDGVAAGDPLKLFGNVNTTIPYAIYGRADVTKPEDLKGKSLAIGQVGDATYLAARLALAPHNLALGTDVQLFPGGNSPSRYAALSSGQVAGAVLDEEAYGKQAEAKGMHLLVSLRQQSPPWIGGGMIATASTLKDYPNTTLAVLKGVLEGTAFFADDKNRDEVLAIMAKDLKAQPTDPAVQAAYESYHKRDLAGPAVQLSAVDATLEGLRAADAAHFANIKSSDVVDNSFADQLQASGFLKTVGR